MPKTRPNKEAEAFGRRLVALLEASDQPRRGAGTYLHRRYGVAVVTANAWLNGEYKPEPPLAKKIATDHGGTFDTLYWGEAAKAQSNEFADWTSVIGYAQAAGLGDGAAAQEWAITHKLAFRADSLSKKHLNPDNLRVMYGKGDSMEPTIKDGDAILFDTTDFTPRNRMVYVLLMDGAADEEYNVKRCRISKGVVTFVADNPDGHHNWKEPRVYGNPDDPFKIVGRVRWTGGWLK